MYFLLLLDFFVLQNLQNICHSLTGKNDKNQDQQTGRNNDVSVHPCQYQLFFFFFLGNGTGQSGWGGRRSRNRKMNKWLTGSLSAAALS